MTSSRILNKSTRKASSLIIIAIITLAVILGSLSLGAYPVSIPTILRILLSLILPVPLPDPAPWSVKEITVIQVIRLPRVTVATMAGLGLGLSGAALQGILRNPLVSPDLVGVTSGAACGGVFALFLNLPSAGVVGFGFAGGLLALTSTMSLARLVKRNGDAFVVVLSGVFVGAFFSALVGILEYTSDTHTQLSGIVYWLLGSFVGADSKKVALIAIPTLGAGSVLMFLRWRMNLLSLGNLDVLSLGFNPNHLRWLIVFLVSLIVASQVAVSGIIGWVGLVVPHLARALVGPDHRKLLPVSGMLGSLFTVLMDDASRTLFSQEIPVGLLTAVVGTPFICFLLWRTQARGWSDD